MERRAHHRVEVSHPVLYISQVYPLANVASTLDISLGGTKIESLQSLKMDEALEMTISIRPRVLKCRGRVVSVHRDKKGKTEAVIQFEDLREDDRLYLKHYLSQIIGQKTLERTSP